MRRLILTILVPIAGVSATYGLAELIHHSGHNPFVNSAAYPEASPTTDGTGTLPSEQGEV